MLVAISIVFASLFVLSVQAQDPVNLEVVGYLGRTVQAVYVLDGYAYVGEGPYLTILDISNPVSPIGQTSRLPDAIQAIHVVGNYAYIADEHGGLQIVDVSDRTDPKMAGSFFTPGAAYGVYVDNNHAYIAMGEAGLLVVDMTTQLTKTFTTQGAAYSVHVVGGRAYIAEHEKGLEVVDVTNLTLLGSRSDVYANDVYVADYAYIADRNNGLIIVNKTSLLTIGQSSFSAFKVHVEDSRAYVVSIGQPKIVDISDPTHPSIIPWTATPNVSWDSRNIYASNGYVYVADGVRGVRIINATNINATNLTAPISTYPKDNKPLWSAIGVQVVGTTGYIAGGWAGGFKLLDTSDPTRPTEISHLAIPSARDLYVAGNMVYIAAEMQGLQVVDVSNKINPIRLQEYKYNTANTRDVYVVGDYVYLADKAQGLLINVKTKPYTRTGTYPTQGQAEGVHVVFPYAYIADGNNGLHIVDVSDPSNPTFVGAVDTPGYANAVYVTGDYAYIADGSNGLQVVNVSDPAHPQLAGSFKTSSAANGVYAAGSYAYIANGGTGLTVIDVSNPASPTLVGTKDTSGNTLNVYVNNNYVYVTDDDNGLLVLQSLSIVPPTVPSVTLSPKRLDFSSQVNTTSATKTVILQNTSGTTLTLDIDNINNMTTGEFELLSHSCPITLVVDASCSLNVVFKPTSVGSKSKTITYGDSNIVTLAGIGTAEPLIPITLDCPSSGTEGETYSCTASVSNVAEPITYTWEVTEYSIIESVGGTSQSQSFKWTPGYKNIKVTAQNGINKFTPANRTITIIPRYIPIDGVSIEGQNAGTVGFDYTYCAEVSPKDATTPITYTWSPEHKLGQNKNCATYRCELRGLYEIGVEVNNGGSSRENRTPVTCFDPVATLEALNSKGPNPLVVTFTNKSYGKLDSSSLNTGDSPPTIVSPFNIGDKYVYTYTKAGTYTAILTITYGTIVKTDTAVIRVYEAAKAKLTTTPISGTTPLSVLMCDKSDGDYNKLTWVFSDNSPNVTSSKPQPCFPRVFKAENMFCDPSKYTAQLTIEGDGGRSIALSQELTVYPLLTADFTVKPLIGTTETSFVFTNKSIGQCKNEWSFGSPERDPASRRFPKGCHTIILTTMSQIESKTHAETICVYDPAIASFELETYFPLVKVPMTFTDTSKGDVLANRTWNFGDGTIIVTTNTIVTHTYETTGSYKVTLSVEGQGGNKHTSPPSNVVVKNPIVAKFTYRWISSDTIQFENQSTGDYDLPLRWDFCTPDNCDFSQATNPTYDPDKGKPLTVTLTVNGFGRSAVARKAIYICDGAVAEFAPSTTSGIAPLVVTFTLNTSGDYDNNIINFGDGTLPVTLTKAITTYVYTYTQGGTYSVVVTATGKCTDDTSDPTPIKVYDKCEASFDASPVEGLSPLTVVFTNTSHGDCKVDKWDFGDDQLSRQPEPGSHKYEAVNIYTPTLTMYGQGGSDVYTKTITVNGYACTADNVKLTPAKSDGKQNLVLTYTLESHNLLRQNPEDCFPEIQWYVNGGGGIIKQQMFELTQTEVLSEQLPLSTTWYATVRSCNIQGCSLPVPSNEAIIGAKPNTPPSVVTATIIPQLPLITEGLELLYGTEDKEKEDTVNVKIRWYKVPVQNLLDGYRKDGISMGNYNNKVRISPNDLKTGEVWCAKLYPSDGKDWGKVAEDCVIIGTAYNRPPMAKEPMITVIRRPGITDTLQFTLTLDYVYDDDQGEAKESTEERIIRWYRKDPNNDKFEFQQKFLNQLAVTDQTALPGAIWFAIIQPHDEQIYGLPMKSNEVKIQDLDTNTPPVARNVRITPNPAKDYNNLCLNYNYEDVDYDAEEDSLIYWYETSVNPSNRLSRFDGQTIIPSDRTLPNQVWYALVEPHDYRDYGADVAADTVQIEAAPPLPKIQKVFISPPLPVVMSDTLVLNYQPHPDNLISVPLDAPLITWKLNGVEQRPLKNIGEVNAKMTQVDDVWCAYITPRYIDGLEGEMVEGGCVTIIPVPTPTIPVPTNITPTLKNPAPYISPEVPTLGEGLGLIYKDYYFDADNDPEGASKIFWYKNGDIITKYNSSPFVRSEAITRGDHVSASVQLYDGKGYSEIYYTPIITVNYPPICSPVVLSTTIVAGEPITLPIITCTDIDGQPLNIKIRWHLTPTTTPKIVARRAYRVARAEVKTDPCNDTKTVLDPYNDQSALPAGITKEGQQLMVCVWANDGYEDSFIVSVPTKIQAVPPPKFQYAYLPLIMKPVPPPTPTPTPTGSPTPIPTHTPTPAPLLTVTPQALNFGIQMIGTPSVSQSITISNSGTADLIMTPWPALNNFGLTSYCASLLQPQANCQVFVTFKPITKGPKQEAIIINSNAPGSPPVVTISGMGQADPCTDEDNDGADTACEIKLGQTITAEPNDDEDYYRLVLTKTTFIRVTVNNFHTKGQLWVYLRKDYSNFETKGQERNLERNNGGSVPNRGDSIKLDPGNYYILVTVDDKAYSNTPYNLVVIER